MIQSSTSKIHWNYFIALEHDLETVARYVEFHERNFDVYSIELARLLFAAASEVDVVAKLLCNLLQPTSNTSKINEYRSILVTDLSNLPSINVFISRYGLSLTPWENWGDANNCSPVWWRDYNNVKHQRDIYFNKATLKNVLNALGALLILTYFYYSYKLAPSGEKNLSPKDTTRQLDPKSTLLTLPENYYYANLIV